MAHPYWPLFDLRIRTPRLELRVPTDDDLVEIATLAAQGIHDPGWTPFSSPWTDVPSPQLERNSMQWGWRNRATTKPDDWELPFAVAENGAIRGVQSLVAKDFATVRQVATGSWLGLAHQGRGIGKEMRAAVLHLAFAHFGAVRATSGAFEDNPASLAVSRALGYVENGAEWRVRRDVPARLVNLLLERESWERTRRDDITVEGLEPCLALLGADANETG